MGSPEDPEVELALQEAERILGTKRTFFSFMRSRVEEEWNPVSIARRYANRAGIAIGLGGIITCGFRLSDMRNEMWTLIPMTVGLAVGLYYTHKYIEAGG